MWMGKKSHLSASGAGTQVSLLSTVPTGVAQSYRPLNMDWLGISCTFGPSISLALFPPVGA